MRKFHKKKAAIYILLVILMSVFFAGCSFQKSQNKISNGFSGSKKQQADKDIKDVVINFQKTQHNRDYKTVKGTEGMEYLTDGRKSQWLKSGYDRHIKEVAKKEKYITQYNTIEWGDINVNKKENTATAEFILIRTIISKNGKLVYKTYNDIYVIDLLKENGKWKIDYSDSK